MGWYLVITEEMRAAGLTGNELLVFALIAGYSQKGQGCYYGGLSYLCEVCGVSKRTAIRTIDKLIAQGLITKKETITNNVKTCSYSITEGSVKITPVVSKLHRGGDKMIPGGGVKMAPNNKYIDNKEDNKIIDLPFSSPQFLDTWSILLKQPKWKKKSVDALRLAAKKLGKYSEQDAIQMMFNTIEGDWQGLFELKTKTTTQTTISNGTNTKQSTNNRIHLGEMGFGTDTL